MTKQNLIKRFFARFMRARAASAAPAFFFAAAAAGFALAPLDASAAKIDADVETGSFGNDTDQSLAVGSGNITIGGDASVDVTETTLLTGTRLTISSTSGTSTPGTLDFGNVTFQQPVASDSITVSGGASVAFDKVAAGAGYGKIDVAGGAALVINGDANLSAITVTAENSALTVRGTATVETLTAKDGATVTLEADDASGVNSLVMAGGTVNVKNFTLDNVDGTNEDNNNASGTISSSETLTVNTGTTLTTEALNLEAKEDAVINLKNGSEIDLGTGTVSLGANAQLNIGDADGAADLTAASLTADDTATTTLNGGTLTLNGAEITQNLDSLAETSTGTVSVSGEDATAVFSADKTFEGDAASDEVLDIAVANGTLQVDAVVSTTGTVTAKNLTIGADGTSVKAAAFELSSKGTLTMNGGKLDLSATSGATTDIYKIAEGSSGTITEGGTAGTIALNKTSTDLGELNFTAESGTVALTGTAEAPITVETAGNVNARNLEVGANMLVGENVTVGKATDRTGDGLTLNGGTLTGTTNVTVNKVVEEGLSGTVDGGTVSFDLEQKDTGTVVAGTLDLGSEETDTNKVWIRGEGLTLGEGSVVTATGDGVNENNGTATGLVVGGAAAGTATVFDLSATETKLNVNAVNVYSADELKLSGDQKIGIGDKNGKIWLGVAATNEAAGKISTTGTLTSLGQTTMNGGRIESTASSPAPAPEQPEEGVFYPEATIHLRNVAMGNGVISAVDGSVKVAEVRDQGIIAAKDISVGSVSDDDTDKVILAGSENGETAAGKLTFTGPTASDISANADSVVNTEALELADGADVTIGSAANANILNEENLASVALGKGASLNTTSGDLSALTSVALATGTADDRTTWTHSSGITVNGDVSVGNYAGITAAGAVSVDGSVSVGNDASIDADGAVSVVGSVSVGNRSDITAESINFGDADLKIGGTATLTSETGDVTLGGVLGLEDGVLATATVNSAKDIVFAADSTSSLHLKATGDIVVNENVSVTLSQGEIDAEDTTLKDGSTFELLGNNNVLGGTGTPEENPYDLSEVTLGNDATLVIGGNNPADESEFYETFAKAGSVKNASADAVGTIEVNGKRADDETPENKVSVFTAGTVGDAANGGVNVTLNEGGELVATSADADGVGIYAAALNGTGGKLTAQAADGTKNDIYVTASNKVGENIAFTADELRVTDLNVSDGADVAVRLENADLSGVNSLVVADAAAAGTDETTKLTLAGTSSVAAVTVGKDGNNGTLFVESLPAEEGEEPAAPVVVIGDLAEDETANFQTGSLTLDGGALVANGGSIDVRNALAAGTNGLDGTLEATVVRVDLSAQTPASFGDALTLKGETVTLDGNASGFALGSVVDADKLVIGSDAKGETTAVIVADPATTLDGVANEIAVENGDSLFVSSAWTPEQNSLTVTLDTNASLGVTGALTVGAGKSFAVNAAVDGEGNVAVPNDAVFDEIVNNGNFSLGNVVASADSWTDAEGATLTITGTKTDTEERLASLDISGAADGTTTFNSAVALTNGALAVAQGNVALNGAVVSENGTVDVEAGDLTANDTVSLTDSTVTADGDVALNGAVSSANGAITAENGSMTVSGGAGTIESLALTAGADITFDTNEFDAEGAVTVVAAQGTGNVTFDTDVSLGAVSSVAADTLTVNAGAAGTINGTVDVETIVLSGATSDPDPVKDAASLTISGEGNSTFTTLTDAAGTTLSLTNGAALAQNGDATASVSLNGTLSVADANSAFSTPGSLTLANTAKLTLANGGAANIAGTLDLSASTADAVTVDGTGTDSDATTTLTAGTLVINPADAADTATQGVVSLTNGGQFTVGELAAGSTVTLTGQNGSGNIWVDETSHFTLKKGDIAITESTRGEIIAESGNVTFGHDADGNGVYELAGIGTYGLDLRVNSGHNEVNFTMSESLNADGTKTYSEVDVRGMMNLQGTEVSATGAEDQAFAVSVASGVNLDNANLTLENVAFSGGKSVSLTGSSELIATNTTIEGFDAIITTVGANKSSITLNNATLNTDVTMNSGTLNVGVEGATIGDGYTVSVNENVSAKLEGDLTGAGKLALNGGNVSLTDKEFTLENVVVNAANAKISGGKTLTIDGLEIGAGDALTVDAALSASGDWNINGGSLTAGTLTIEGGANVTLENNSTFNGDIVFADGADAELSLTNSTVAGNVTLDGENNMLKVTDSSITGTLEATAGSIIFNGTNSFGDLRLVSNVNIGGVLDVVGKLEVEGGFELEKASELSTTEGLFVNGGIATLEGTVTQGDVTLTGTGENSTLSGTIETNLTLDNAQISSSGKVVGSTTLTNGSTLTQTAGTLGAVSVDASTFTQNAGTAGAVTLTNGSTLTQTEDGTLGAVTLTNGASATLAGTVDSLYATNATANVSGTIETNLKLDNAQLTQTDGKVVGSTTLTNGSKLTQTEDGSLGAVTLTNGTSATLAGTVASLDATNATAEVSGEVEGSTTLANDSTLTQKGGLLGAVSVDASTFTQEATGTAGKVTLTNDAFATLAGTVASLDATNGSTLTQKDGSLGAVFVDASNFTQEAGTVASLDATNGSELTQKGGSIGAVSVDASTFTQESAGTADAVTLTNGAFATLAGTVDSLDATNAKANVSGTVETNLKLDAAQISSSGTVEGSTTLASDSTLTQTDGTLDAVSVDASTFTQESAGTAGAVTLTNGASATLAGTVASLDAKNGSELTQTGGTLGAVFVDASNFTQEAGTVSGDMTLTNGASATLAGTVASLDAKNGSELTQTGGTLGAVFVDASNFTQEAGTVSGDMTLTNATAEVSGEVVGDTTLTNVSTLTQTDGTLHAVSVDASTFTQNAGTAGAVTLTNGASATLAGTVASLDATNATANVSGKVSGDMTLTNATAEVSGTVEGSTMLANGSALTQTAGTLGAVSVDASTFTQEAAGTAGKVTLTNGASAKLAGTVASLDAKNAKANVSGTVEGAVSLDASTLTAQGDKTFASLSLKNGSTLVSTDDITVTGAITDASGSISGANITVEGAITNASGSISGVNVALNGGLTGSASVTASEGLTLGGVWNVDGGSLTAGTLTIADGANVALTNSTVDGDITFADGADAELSLTESTVAGNVTLDGENNTLKVTDSSITGTLEATAGSITFNGTNSFGNLRLDSDVNIGGVVAVDGKLEVEGGFELGKASKLSTAEGLFVNGGIATLAGTVTQGDVTLTGTDENSTLSGTIETNLTLDAAQLTQTDGEVVGDTTLANGSKLTQTGGSLDAVSVDASTFTQEAAGTAGAVTLTNGASAKLAGTVASLDAKNGSELTQTGGTLGAVFVDASNFTQEAGTVSGDMTLTNATAEVSGEVVGDTTLTNVSTLTQTDGTLHAVSVDASTFTQNAGTAGAVTLTNGASATLAGTVDSLDATNAKANVSGTVEGAVSLDASTLTAQGDKTFASLSLKNGSTLVSTDDITVTGAITDASGSISGANITVEGAITNASGSISGVNVALNGGLTGSASVTASEGLTLGGVWNVDGGSLTAGTLTIADGANVALTNSTVDGDITFADGADAELSLTESTVAGNVTLDGENNTLKVTDSSITGTLEATAGSITFNGTNSFGNLRLDSDVNIGGVVAVDGKLEVEGGFELGKASELSTAEGLFVKDGTAKLEGTVTQGDVTLTGTDENSTLSGTIETNLTLNNAQLTQTDGTVKGSTTLANGSTLTQTAGTLGAVSVDASTFTQEAAGTAGAVTLTNDAFATLAGTVASLDATNATANVSGKVSGDMTLTNTTAEVSGEVVGSTMLANGSALTQTDGTLGAVSVDASTFTQEAGTAGAVTLTNGASATLAGTVASLDATNAKANVSGTVSGSTTLANGSELTQTAGKLGAVSVDASNFTQNAGTAGKVTLTNGASATLAGTVASLDATNATAEVSGTVVGSTTLANGSELTQTAGTLGAVSVVDASTFTQNAGTAGAVSVDASTFTQEAAGTAGAVTLTNDASATLAGTVASLDATNAKANVSGTVSGDMTLTNATANVSGTVEGAVSLDASTLTAQGDKTFASLSLKNDSTLVSTDDITVTGAITDASGSISGVNVALNGGLTGSASVSASGDLTLGGTTETSGKLTAGTLTVADGGTLTATDAQVEAGTLAVSEGATLNLTIEEGLGDDTKLSIDGTANLTAANALTLSNLSGAGTANKTGAGALTLSGNGAFTGALNIGAGNASLSGAFGGSIGFASEGGTITGARGASVAGTLTLAQGTTLEIGDASGAATLTVGKIALADATARAAGTAKVVHDVFADGTNTLMTDTLTVTDATANLSGLTAVVRSNVDEEILGVGGQTITLVEGDVAAGYGFIEGIGFDRTNAVLSEDGKSLQVMLNWKAAADGLAGSLFNDNQRAVAAATKGWNASTNKYAQALSTLSTTETAAALDDLGALHTVAMMPGQIDGTWNHQKSVLNAIGTGSQMGYQFGKPDVNMGAWVQYVGSYNDVDSSSDRLGWDRTMNGATAGFEYAVSENFLAGVALGYEYAELKSDGNKIEDDAFSVDFFAKHRSGDFEQRAALTFAHHGYDTNRTIAFGGVAESVSGDTDGFTAAIAYEAAYNFAVKEYLTLAPVATLRAALNTIDGWSESGSDAALKFDDQSAFTALAGIGGRAEFAFANPSYPREALRLSAYALFTAEFGDRSSDVDASFVRGGNAFTMTYDDPEPYALQLGLTAFAPLTNRTALFGGISTELRDEESGFNANIGVRIGW